ncbi:MAG: AIPR family protein [Candidatus Magnetobacterium sp. LHC-1]|nr:AIPR family protein [Nitrospirota bacterium]
MSILHLRHIRRRLEDVYKGMIDVSDARSEQEREVFFLTRAYAAYTLEVLSGVESATAAGAVVDGYGDNGIDLLYFDRINKFLWIIQSKWFKNARGEPDSGDISKFVKGIRDLLELNLELFNEKVRMKKADIFDALDDSLVKTRIVLAFTGQDNLSANNQSIIDNLLYQLNDFVDSARYEIFALRHAHKSLSGSLRGTPINAELILYNWGKVEEPYNAIYGTVSGYNIASIWLTHKNSLFSENMREFLGYSKINDDIINTIIHEPQNFFYYNNGITALCNRIEKKPFSAGDRNLGGFVFDNFKIINGAQTVGSLGDAFEKYPDKVELTRVFIKIILLSSRLDKFGINITKKTNSQNKIDKKDFVFLDPQQHILNTDLMLEGFTYHYKRSDENHQYDKCNVIYLEEVIASLACANHDVELAVQAKREIGKLWDDINEKPYTDIITPSVTAHQVIRAVQISRATTKILKSKALGSSGRIRSHYTYGNRLFLHAVFKVITKTIGPKVLMEPNFDFEDFKTTKLDNIILDTIEKIMTLVDAMHSDLLLYHLYRNVTKCRELMKQFCTGA